MIQDKISIDNNDSSENTIEDLSCESSNNESSTENIIKAVQSKLKTKKIIDLFCGIGGFHTALNHFDFECLLACDIDKA